MVIKDNKLFNDSGEQVTYLSSPNFSNSVKPLYLVIHYTGGSTTKACTKWFQMSEAQASAHLVIGRDGEIIQMVPFNKQAWHAGISQWGQLKYLNRFSIGIELVNAGILTNKNGTWVDVWNNPIAKEDTIEAVHKNQNVSRVWHDYTKEQLDALVQVSLALHKKYEFDDILGHDDIAPDRKIDPGPAFPMDQFKSMVMGRK